MANTLNNPAKRRGCFDIFFQKLAYVKILECTSARPYSFRTRNPPKVRSHLRANNKPFYAKSSNELEIFHKRLVYSKFLLYFCRRNNEYHEACTCSFGRRADMDGM